MNMFRLVALFLLSLQILHAKDEANFDEEAFTFESTNSLRPIDTKHEVSQFYALKEKIDEEEGRISIVIPDTYLFIHDDAPLNPKKESELPDLCYEAEKFISSKIKNFIKNSKTYRHEIKSICVDYEKLCTKNGKDCWPSDIAQKIARFFKSEMEVSLALKFYLLSKKSPRAYEAYIFLDIADLFVHYINTTIENTKPKKPTPEIFSALMKAIYYNSLDDDWDGIGSLGEAKNNKLIKHRDLIVRWPLSPERIARDTYYDAGALLSFIYRPGFVSNLLKDVQEIKELWTLKKFNGSHYDDNIFNYLYERGFICRKGFISGLPQYILINEKGYLVRIKCKNGQWQFTAGLVLKNPYEWKDYNPIRLLKGSNESHNNSQYGKDTAGYDFLDEHQFNEILKIKFHNGMTQVIPSAFFLRVMGQDIRNVNYWRNYDDSTSFMNEAHYDIEPVGRRKKPGSPLDTSSIDVWCTKVDPKTGEIQ